MKIISLYRGDAHASPMRQCRCRALFEPDAARYENDIPEAGEK